MKLFVKVWCPWCVSAREWLDKRGYQYELVDVEENDADYEEIRRISGQSKTPTLLTHDGLVLPDFGPEELAAFIKENNITP